MEINGENEHGSKRDVDIPLSYLRLLAPPLQLLSAAVWQIVQQGRVDRFGMLEEFVTMVTELVPELMCYSQRAQLIMGLRARLVLEMCRGEEPVDMQTIQPHLDRIKAPVSTAKDHHVTINQVEESEVNFVELVHSILEDPSERTYFFEEIFPVYFGPKFDEALEMLLWEFISRLDKLLPVPDFTQLTAVLGETPTFLDDCLQSFLPPEDIKAVLTHHRNLGHLKEKDPQLLPMDNCILSSLSLPPGTKAIPGFSPEHAAALDSSLSLNSLERSFMRSLEVIRQGLSETIDTDLTQLQDRSRSSSREKKKTQRASDETIDLTESNEPEDVDLEINEEGCRRSGRVLRKRKPKETPEIPSKRPVDHAALSFFDSSIDDENSGESPLISILGEYTDSQENPLPVVSDKLPWSEEETLHLLDVWGKDSVQRALKGCLKNRHIFTQIAQKMAERGYVRSVEQCQSRIKRLKKSYRQKNRGNSKQEGKFYEKLQSILHSPGSSAVPEVTFDVEEVVDEDEADNDLQFVGLATQPEKATRSAPWTDFETMTLITMWGEAKTQQELRGTYRSSRIFALISKKLSSHGYSRTSEQCQTRLKRLKTNFRQCYQNNLREQEQTECKFYNELGHFLVKDFTPVPQVNKTLEEYDDDFSAFPQLDTESVMGSQEDRRKVPWSDKETIILIEIWGDEQVQQTLKRYPHNGHLFTQISERLAANGFYRSPDQCLTRIKRLKTSYRLCQESLRSSGSDKVDFKFYDLLEQIMDKQPSTSSTVISDSIEISEDSNEGSLSEMDGGNSSSTEKSANILWSDQETVALINIWGEDDVQKALRGFVHNGRVYDEISEQMQNLGYPKSPEQCRWKVKSLRNNFRQHYDRKKNGGKVDYKFYNLLEEVLGQEAVSMDEFDERDDETKMDAVGFDDVNGPWTEQETAALIELWAADAVQHSLKTSVRNSHIFAEIAEKLAHMGYLRTAEVCHARIQRLKKTYRRYCRKGGGRPSMFQYFHLLAPVLGDDTSFQNVDGAAAESTSQPLDQDSDLYEEPSTSLLQPDQGRKMTWSTQETRTLLGIWGEDGVQQTLRGCLKNRHVFHYIAEKMSDHGFVRTSEQCYTRVKRLKHAFQHERNNFKFFSEMDEIFRKELKADDSAVDMFAAEEPDDEGTPQTAPPSPQWMPDSAKLVWRDAETKALLDIWGSEEIQENLKSCTKNRHVFTQISQLMSTRGYTRSPEQCQTRIKRLRATFRQFLEGRKGEKQECKFFEQLMHSFGNKYSLPSDCLAEDAADGEEPES